MGLPVLNSAVYELEIPSTKKIVKFRPYLVKEQKALLIAQQSEDIKIIINTLKKIVKDCITDKIDVDKLATFDLEYIFLQIRSKSSGENAQLEFTCPNCKDFKVAVNFDLSTIKVNFPKDFSNNIQLTNNVGVILKYPTVDIIEIMGDDAGGDINSIFEVLMQSLESIYDENEIYNINDYTKDELIEFFDNLNTDQFKKITDFFKNMPKLTQPVNFTCTKCGHIVNSELEGISNFF